MITGLLLLDIESVPQSEAFEKLDPAWQSLFVGKISKTVPEAELPEETYRKKAGILAEFGKIVCISTAYFYAGDDGHYALKMKSIYGDQEAGILTAFTQLCNRIHKTNPDFQFAGHNIREFDIPFICRRMLVNNLPLPPYLRLHERKPWEVKMFDTLTYWKFGDIKNYISLDLLAHVLDIPTSKTDMDGSMVQDVYYKEHDLERIVAYCQRDVVVVANIILRFKGLPLLKAHSIVVV